MPKDISVAEAHRMCDHLEKDIKSKLRHASLTIHVEPCGEDCEKCPVPPERRQEKH
jgi:divalent metal cation (Fe/Co/Zn/Cd) transporter